MPRLQRGVNQKRDYRHQSASDGDGTPVKPLSLALKADQESERIRGADPRAKAHTLASQATKATSGCEYGPPATFDSAYNHSMGIRKGHVP